MIWAWSLTFQGTPLTAALSVVCLIVATTLCLLAWRRRDRSVAAGVLEGLRLLIVLLIVLTFNQPEWLKEYRPETRPTLLVLRDVSRSMETRDVIDNRQPQLPQTRAESVQSLCEPSIWKPVSNKLDVVLETFSSSLSDPASGTDLYSALNQATEQHETLRAIVLLSDGDWNVGEPPVQAASHLRIKRVPVFVVGVGSESRLPDVELARLDAPTFGVQGKPMRIPFVIESALPHEYHTQVTLTPSSGRSVTKDVTLPAMGRLEDTVVWTPDQKGELTLTLSVPADDAELLSENNVRTVPIVIRQEAIKVLLVESFPRWEYRYLRNALARDPGVELSCLLFHPGLRQVGAGKGYLRSFPDTLRELASYDVVFLGDVEVADGQLTTEQCRLIKGLVQNQASGLILMPGLRGGHLSLIQTELGKLYPVVLDRNQPHGWGSRTPAQLELTATGRRSSLTRLEDSQEQNARLWETLPGFQWHAAVVRAKAGTDVLATHRSESNQYGRIPLLATRTHGTGKILFMGTDGAWRWREGVEDKYHYRFWGQVARWMAYQRNMAQGQLVRLYYTPDRPRTGDTVTLHANVMGLGGEPLQQAAVVVEITGPSGKSQSIRLAPSGAEWGLFTGTYTATEAGKHQLTLRCRENRSSLQVALAIDDAGREQCGQPARFDVLSEIARVSQGKMAATSNLHDLLADIAALPEPEPRVRRLRLWCHPLWAALLVSLLGGFWIGRKLVGTI